MKKQKNKVKKAVTLEVFSSRKPERLKFCFLFTVMQMINAFDLSKLKAACPKI